MEVSIDKNAFLTLVGAAQSYYDDLVTGIDDGTYESDGNSPDELYDALNLAEGILKETSVEKIKEPIGICSWCESENVLLDAWAVQDKDTGEWELETTFDAAWCNDCEGETSLKDKEI